MVDVGAKDVTARVAVAAGRLLVSPQVHRRCLRGEGVPKGDALGIARIAGILGAKRTPDLIPLCHPIADLRREGRARAHRRRGRDPGDGEDHRPHRRRDGSADRRRRRRADAARHGQSGRPGGGPHRRAGDRARPVAARATGHASQRRRQSARRSSAPPRLSRSPGLPRRRAGPGDHGLGPLGMPAARRHFRPAARVAAGELGFLVDDVVVVADEDDRSWRRCATASRRDRPGRHHRRHRFRSA